MGKQNTKSGFTIVELLIVIVIIAILATITIVAFNGVTQRAKNSAKVSNVESIAKLIKLYHVDHQAYPLAVDGGWCLTTDNTCTQYNGTVVSTNNSALMTALREFGTPPASAGDDTSGTYYGIQYLYSSTRQLDSVVNPLILVFWLNGTNQTCAGAVSGMVSVKDGAGTMVEGAQSKADTGTNQTRCYMMFPN